MLGLKWKRVAYCQWSLIFAVLSPFFFSVGWTANRRSTTCNSDDFYHNNAIVFWKKPHLNAFSIWFVPWITVDCNCVEELRARAVVTCAPCRATHELVWACVATSGSFITTAQILCQLQLNPTERDGDLRWRVVYQRIAMKLTYRIACNLNISTKTLFKVPADRRCALLIVVYANWVNTQSCTL